MFILDPIYKLKKKLMSLTLHTSHGNIRIILFIDFVPIICFNFLAIAASNGYDGTLFHRLIPSFIIQGGDPTGKGKGGESVWGGKIPDQFHPKARHDSRGILSMANAGPNTNGSQFFFTFGEQKHLDEKYCVFGKIEKGMEVLDSMEKVPTHKKNRPIENIILYYVTIHSNPLADQPIPPRPNLNVSKTI